MSSEAVDPDLGGLTTLSRLMIPIPDRVDAGHRHLHDGERLVDVLDDYFYSPLHFYTYLMLLTLSMFT
jgi:hypothetical protein